MIPRVVHQIWLGNQVPPQVERWHGTWKDHHPGWTVKMWRDADVEKLRVPQQYAMATVPAVRADIARLTILREYGGVYVDADIECHASVAPLIEGARRVVLSEGAYITNSFAASVPEDRFIIDVETRVAQLEKKAIVAEEHSPLALTGPLLWTEVFSLGGFSQDSSSRILAADYFVVPKTRNEFLIEMSAKRRFGTHHALATWRKTGGALDVLRRTRLRTRFRRFFDLSAQ